MTAALSNSQKLSEFTKVFQYQSKENLETTSSQGHPNNQLGPHYEVPNLSSMLYEFTNKE